MVAIGAVRSVPQLRSGMVVKGGMGKRLGTVAEIVMDPASGNLESFTVKHGLFRKRYTRVGAADIRHLNSDSVVLRVKLKEFRQLPVVEDQG